MIIWLASYPRSGNTMLRMILKSVFRQGTYSKYNELADVGTNRNMMELIGHKMLPDDWENVYQTMQQSGQLFFIKTHDPPEDDFKTIYVVRDGRASIISYWHYLKDFINKEYAFSDLIAGFVNFGSWGSHLDAWNPLNRSDTLLIHYERLLTNPQEEIEEISGFLGLDIVGHWRNDFEYFHKISPQFFREGHALKGVKALQGDDLDIFWLFHGDWMDTLGYAKWDEKRKYNACPLRKITHRAYKSIESSKAERNSFRAERDAMLNRFRAERDAMLNSLSWKLTKPMRMVLDKISKKILQRG